MKQNTSLLLLILLLFSCAGEEKKESQTSTPSNADDFRVFKLSLNAEEASFSDLVEEVEIMRLEETDQSYLSYANGIVPYEDGFVLPDFREGNIYFFDHNGDFQRRINKMGQGPEEYETMRSFWVKNGQLGIWDMSNTRIKTFDFEGNLIDSKRTAYNGIHALPYEDGYVMDMSMNLIDDTLQYNVLVLDKDLAKKELLSPFKDPVPFPLTSTNNTFRPYKNGLVYKHSYLDTVYYFSPENKIAPLMVLDFGDQLLWHDEGMYSDGELAMQNINTAGKIWIYNTWVGEDMVYIGYNTSFREYGNMVLNRSNGAYRLIDFSVGPNDELDLNPILWQNNRLLMSMESTDVATLTAGMEDSQWKFREGTTLEEIESSENPVLVWVKFKEGMER